MRHSLIALPALLLLAVGCQHTSRLPTLPASHGQLSKVMDQYLNPEMSTEEHHAAVYQPLPDDMPTVVVEVPGRGGGPRQRSAGLNPRPASPVP
ncbi:hypothetical protein [Pyxidicoccus xibeiensis]|uniref:hypothetical protein n=1 Tax=Pyxidicoccus xibeiensis TaxID=2906759 RepID=UPI0020A80E30|nr:hypothetical protein [Pyxidicoccus xibeiensis]MCP3140337.1 hypothetical protein [Pyxidicoccus xibeiensis]